MSIKDFKEIINYFAIHPIIKTTIIVIFIIVIGKILWTVLLKDHFIQIVNSVRDFPNKIKAIGEMTTLLEKINEKNEIIEDCLKKIKDEHEIIEEGLKEIIYSRLENKLIKAKEIGGITSYQNTEFMDEWNRYIKLGDGHGDSLKRSWDKLFETSPLSNDEYCEIKAAQQKEN